MNNIDVSLFADIANKLGLSNGAFIEKDYWAIQLLKTVIGYEFADWELCFAGGTCLTKVHCSTYRMSEDIDIKLIPKPKILKLSQNQRIKLRKKFKLIIQELISKNKRLHLISEQSRDSGCYMAFDISYPKSYKDERLRPELKLEFTEKEQYLLDPILSNISSIYADEMGQQPEIKSIVCDKLETILVEKFISLLRRTAEAARGYINEENEEKTLIRHVYDLSLIFSAGYDVNLVKSTFISVVEEERTRFGNRHAEFYSKPKEELLYGLKTLSQDKKHEDRYEEYLKPFVYNSNAPHWDEGIKIINNLADSILE